jgi:hypothetical protein
VSEQPSENKARSQPFGFWIAIGVGIGSGIGVAIQNIAIGVAIGVALGVAIGFVQQQQANKKSEDQA